MSPIYIFPHAHYNVTMSQPTDASGNELFENLQWEPTKNPRRIMRNWFLALAFIFVPMQILLLVISLYQKLDWVSIAFSEAFLLTLIIAPTCASLILFVIWPEWKRTVSAVSIQENRLHLKYTRRKVETFRWKEITMVATGEPFLEGGLVIEVGGEALKGEGFALPVDRRDFLISKWEKSTGRKHKTLEEAIEDEDAKKKEMRREKRLTYVVSSRARR